MGAGQLPCVKQYQNGEASPVISTRCDAGSNRRGRLEAGSALAVRMALHRGVGSHGVRPCAYRADGSRLGQPTGTTRKQMITDQTKRNDLRPLQCAQALSRWMVPGSTGKWIMPS